MAAGLTFLGDSLVSFPPLRLSKVLLGAALQDPMDEGARPLPCVAGALVLSFRTLTLRLAFETHKVTKVTTGKTVRGGSMLPRKQPAEELRGILWRSLEHL